MNHVLSLRELTDRLIHIESKVDTIWLELVNVRQQPRTTTQMPPPRRVVAHFWADKAMHRQWFGNLFTRLSIQGVPIGAEMFQKMTHQAGLTPNELSRAIVEAREE